MKSILTLALCLLFNHNFAITWHPKIETLTDFELKGNVREIIVDSKCAPFDTVPLINGIGLYVKSRNGCWLNAKFNEAGYLTYRKILYDQLNSTYEIHVEYLNDTLPIKFTEIEHEDTIFYLIDYDSNFRMTRISHSDADTKYSWCDFIYDDEKNRIYIKDHYNSKSAAAYTNVEIYNEQRQLKAYEERRSKYFGKVRSTVYEYNTKGLLVSKVFRDTFNKGKSDIGLYEYTWELYEYDQFGNQITVLECVNLEKQPLKITRTTYNDNRQIATLKDSNFIRGWWYLDSINYTVSGQIESVLSYNDGLPWRVINYSYDESGNMLSQITKYHLYLSSSDTELQQWKNVESSCYEYDHQGNWIKLVRQDQEGLTKSTSRTIAYY